VSAAYTGTNEPTDQQILTALRMGDEAAFTGLVERHSASMLRIALIYVNDQATAEEVVQETWVAALRGLNGFEGRSSLKTWLFTILTNRARTRAVRENRYVPLEIEGELEAEPIVTPERFNPPGGQFAYHWADGSQPQHWDLIPEDRLLAQETRAVVLDAIESLPPNQRQVIRLRDVEGFSAAEVCNMLEISETNQRVLLHRARGRVRQALELYLMDDP